MRPFIPSDIREIPITPDNPSFDINYKAITNTKVNSCFWGDCLSILPLISDKSIDMIFCDLPYEKTGNHWDKLIDQTELWKQYRRIIKDNGAIVLTAVQPFSSMLVMNNLGMYKDEWIWEKSCPVRFMKANDMSLRYHEQILLFSKGKVAYNPIFVRGTPYKQKAGKRGKNYQEKNQLITINKGIRYPKSVLKFYYDLDKIHPTQKPVALVEYFIRTYSNESDLILDNCAGSFSTALACDNSKRNWICIEKNQDYCNKGFVRINKNRDRLKIENIKEVNYIERIV